jgi:predicted RNA-binding Zn-ribbon protein involved in translation (DUF1610 family)
MSSSKKHYLVIECTRCRRFLLAVSRNETRTCPYCGKRVRLEGARVVVRSESAEDARVVLQDLKAREHQGDSNGFR